MGKYIYFTPEERERASHTDITDLLRQQGEQLIRSGSEWQWGEGSNKITIRNSEWFHQYERTGGDAISFVMRFYNKSFQEAVLFLLEGDSGGVVPQRVSQSLCKHKPEKQLVLPPQHDNMRRVYSYLMHKRGLDCRVLDAFVNKKMIYESARNHNAVFVGYDKDDVPRHAHKRSTAEEGTYKGNVSGSQAEYSFHWHGSSSDLFLFEAPIDMLSYITMLGYGWERHSYAAACSVSDRVLFQMLKDNPNIHNVYIAFDNDEAGQTAGKKLCEMLTDMGISAYTLVPVYKDWNEDLVQGNCPMNKADEEQAQKKGK